MDNKHTMTDLYQMQSLPLSTKIQMTQRRIKDWIDYYGCDGVYVCFSGGKDSTVLLDMVRQIDPSVLAVFVDTGLEYPEIREFVKTYTNVQWIKPKKTFKQVIEEYGFPFISKEVSDKVQGARKYARALEEYTRTVPYGTYPIPTERYKEVMGTATKKDGSPSAYNSSKYQFFLEAPFEISARCCDVMKKSPSRTFANQTGRKPITAQMASESRLRTSAWLKNGCNGFDMTSPISNPMSFWTDQDVLLYIKENNLPICSVYGDVVTVDEESGQTNLADFMEMEEFELDRPLLHTTGCQRTGCVLCGFGCHLEKKNRFELLKQTHPKFHNLLYVLKNNGITYAEAIDWVNEHGHFNIKY